MAKLGYWCQVPVTEKITGKDGGRGLSTAAFGRGAGEGAPQLKPLSYVGGKGVRPEKQAHGFLEQWCLGAGERGLVLYSCASGSMRGIGSCAVLFFLA